MAYTNFGGHGLHMRNLERPEYHLMKAMQERYNLDSAAEVFEVALRLMYEVMQMEDLHGNNIGHTWIISAINAIRTMPKMQRVYTVEDKAQG